MEDECNHSTHIHRRPGTRVVVANDDNANTNTNTTNCVVLCCVALCGVVWCYLHGVALCALWRVMGRPHFVSSLAWFWRCVSTQYYYVVVLWHSESFSLETIAWDHSSIGIILRCRRLDVASVCGLVKMCLCGCMQFRVRGANMSAETSFVSAAER